MSYAGHVAQMIRSIEQNNAMRRKRREHLRKLRSNQVGSGKRNIFIKKRKKLPEEELNRINTINRRIIIKERRLLYFKTFIGTIVVLTVISYLVYRVIQNSPTLF